MQAAHLEGLPASRIPTFAVLLTLLFFGTWLYLFTQEGAFLPNWTGPYLAYHTFWFQGIPATCSG